MIDPVNRHDLPGLEEGPNGSWCLYHSSTKMIATLVGALIFVIIGVWLATSTDGLLRAVGGYVGVLFFGPCAVFATWRLARPTPALFFDVQGLDDRASAISVGRLAWTEIDRIVPYQFSNQWMLGIYPTDLKAILSRQNAFRRLAIKANLGLGAAPINIPQGALPVKVTQLAQFLGTTYGVEVGTGS